MKKILKTSVSVMLIWAMLICQLSCVGMAAFLNGGTQKYMYNGIIITSDTYTCEASDSGETGLKWTIYDESKKARDWPATVVVEGDIVYDSHRTGAKLCTLTVGNTYDIRVVFVHSATSAPYYYLMIEGEGVTGTGLKGTYTDGVWISNIRMSLASKITNGDGIESTYGNFTLDHVTVTDDYENPDIFYNNHGDFRSVQYQDGAIVAELLWTPDADSINAQNVKLMSGETEVAVDRFECDGNKLMLYSKEITRGETYTILLADTTKTALGTEIRIPLKTEYTVPYNEADITGGSFSDNSFTLNARNLTEDDFKFTVLIALKSEDGITQEIIVSDEYTVSPGEENAAITVENLDFKSLIPEAYVVKSAMLPVPVSDRKYK